MTSHGPGVFLPLRWLCPHIRFVDVWHGLGYKAYSPSDHRMHRFYAATFVSSPYFRDLYCARYGYDPAQAVVTGYARVDAFQHWQAAAARVRRELGLPEGRRVILFAPTWRGRREPGEFPFGLSLPELLGPLDALCERLDATLIFRLHMNSSLRGDTSAWPRVLDLPQARFPDTNALLTAADLAVTDWSSLACDFAVLNRPVVFLDTPEPLSYTSGQTGVPRAGELAGTLEELLAAIERSLALDADQVRAIQAPVVEACYGDTLDGRCGQRYDEAIRALLARGGQDN
jgi:CDP-glycerol glycerophosphotransferase (TagB/SpsB family)